MYSVASLKYPTTPPKLLLCPSSWLFVTLLVLL